ncbi:hypothetical protein VWH97_05905 [Escherichia coli O157]|nr:hypothetical protein [Escherichia coli O157]
MRVDIKVPFKCEPLKFVQDYEISKTIEFSETASKLDISRKILGEKYPDVIWDDFNPYNMEKDEMCKDEIIGFVRMGVQNLKYYAYICQKCSTNSKQNGLGIFFTLKRYIKNKITCMCSKTPLYTNYQRTIQLHNKSISLGYVFIGYNKEKQITSDAKIKLGCYNHGMWDTITINSYNTNSRGCSKCAGVHSPSQEEANEKIKQICNENKLVFQPFLYKNNKTKIFVRCLVCNESWESNYFKLYTMKYGCQRCVGTKKLTTEISTGIVSDYCTKYKLTFIPFVYDNNKMKISLRCDICSHEWITPFNGITNRMGCPRCNPTEAIRISKDLDPLIDDFQPEKKFLELGKMRFDRFSQRLNILFEYDGEQHFISNRVWHSTTSKFESSRERDSIKTEYAIKNGYNFIRIAYYEDHIGALKSFLKLIEENPGKQIVQIYGDVQILDKK